MREKQKSDRLLQTVCLMVLQECANSIYKFDLNADSRMMTMAQTIVGNKIIK